MQTENKKKGNLNLILCGIIAVMAIILWFQNCSGKEEVQVINIPELKGKFEAVDEKDIEVKSIPAPAIGQNVSKHDLSKIDNFKALYKLTQMQYDSLVVVNRTLDSLANASNDKRYQELYSNCKLIEFKHEFNNDTMNITLTGLSRGAPKKLKVNYTIKARKQEVKIPTTVLRVLGGVEVGMTKTLSNINTKANIGFQNKKGNILTIAADTDQRFYVGYTASIFSIKR